MVHAWYYVSFRVKKIYQGAGPFSPFMGLEPGHLKCNASSTRSHALCKAEENICMGEIEERRQREWWVMHAKTNIFKGWGWQDLSMQRVASRACMRSRDEHGVRFSGGGPGRQMTQVSGYGPCRDRQGTAAELSSRRSRVRPLQACMQSQRQMLGLLH